MSRMITTNSLRSTQFDHTLRYLFGQCVTSLHKVLNVISLVFKFNNAAAIQRQLFFCGLDLLCELILLTYQPVVPLHCQSPLFRVC